MGCGCKDKSALNDALENNLLNNEDNSIGNILIRLVPMIIMLIILSPVIFIAIWVLAINSAIKGNFNPIQVLNDFMSRRENKLSKE